MQVGTENRPKLIIMLVLAVIGAVMLVRAFTASDNVTAAPAATPAPTQPVRSQVKKSASDQKTQSLDPTIRLDLLRSAEDTKYEGKGRNIFRAELEPLPVQGTDPKLKCKITPDAPGCPGYDPCKANPTIKGCPLYKEPINLKFFGFANRPGERKKVFLSGENGDVFIAGEGDTVNRRYRVLRIGVNSVEIKDVLNDNTQTIPLTQG